MSAQSFMKTLAISIGVFELKNQLIALERRNSELAALHDAFSGHDNAAADLSISGLIVLEGANIKTLVTAVLKTKLQTLQLFQDRLNLHLLKSRYTLGLC